MLKAKDIMTREVITVREDTPIREVARIFLDKRLNGVPVVHSQGQVLGVICNSDLIDQAKKLHIPTVIAIFDAVFYIEGDKQFKKDLEKITASTVRDVYTRDPITITPETTVEDIATIMADKQVHTLPVVEGDKLVGVVGKIDVIRSMIS